MSRVGLRPTEVPNDVTVTIDGNHVTSQGAKRRIITRFSP